MAVDNAVTGEVLTTVADASPQDGRCALDAAVRAQRGWAKTAPRRRSDILRRAFDLVLAREDDLALLMTHEMGKPLAEARGEVRYAADGYQFVRWGSGAVRTTAQLLGLAAAAKTLGVRPITPRR